ncbi:uncharacterized protein [Oscarella lobularis]|uniref:uncharacterized protein n=1 Tax=Oscarella lobularis TaxID=121494 RepID=UPI00331318AD
MDPRSGRSGATSRFNDERTRTHVQTQSVVQTRGAAPRHCAIALSSSDSDDGLEEAGPREARGGYNETFVETLDVDVKCSICLLAMRDPMITICGHKFCKSCLLGLTAGDTFECRECREKLYVPSQIFPENACKRKIMSLKVKCRQHNDGCTWIGKLESIEEHWNNECEARAIADVQNAVERLEHVRARRATRKDDLRQSTTTEEGEEEGAAARAEAAPPSEAQRHAARKAARDYVQQAFSAAGGALIEKLADAAADSAVDAFFDTGPVDNFGIIEDFQAVREELTRVDDKDGDTPERIIWCDVLARKLSGDETKKWNKILKTRIANPRITQKVLFEILEIPLKTSWTMLRKARYDPDKKFSQEVEDLFAGARAITGSPSRSTASLRRSAIRAASGSGLQVVGLYVVFDGASVFERVRELPKMIVIAEWLKEKGVEIDEEWLDLGENAAQSLDRP